MAQPGGDPNWEPDESDVVWMKVLVKKLKPGGIWAAPMGFIFKKTGENELELIRMENNPRVNDAIGKTFLVAERAGVVVKDPSFLRGSKK